MHWFDAKDVDGYRPATGIVQTAQRIDTGDLRPRLRKALGEGFAFVALDQGKAALVGERIRRRRSIDRKPGVGAEKEDEARFFVTRENDRRIARSRILRDHGRSTRRDP